MHRFRSIFNGRFWAAIVSGSLIGVLVVAIVLLWRGGKSETIVLQVQPVDDPNIVRVYVGGEVVTPGLYSLPRGSRVAEAIQAAGGATAVGDTAGFGMAAVIEDADQIIVPARRAVATPASVLPVSGASGIAATQPPDIVSTQINIKIESADELDSLPGAR